MNKKEFNEVKYKCSNPECGHEQTIRFFLNDTPLKVTNCVKCRAGFNVPLQDMIYNGIGMFPVEDVPEGDLEQAAVAE